MVQWPVSIVGGVFAGVLVPFAVKLEKINPSALPNLRYGSLLIVAGLGTGTAVAVFLLLPTLISLPWLGLTSVQQQAALSLRVLSIIVPVSMMSCLLAAWTMAANKHANTIFESLPPLTILVSVAVSGGLAALAIGTVLGLLFQMIALFIYLATKSHLRATSAKGTAKYWQQMCRAAAPLFIGQSVMSLVSLVDQVFAARIGPGALSIMSYTNQITGLVLALGATTISRAMLPVFSLQSARDPSYSSRTTWLWLVVMVSAGGLIVFFIWGTAGPLVALIFQRGNFTGLDSRVVAEALQFSVIQVPFYFGGSVLGSALLAGQHTRAFLILGIIGATTKIISGLILVPVLGLKGLFLATAITYLVTMLVMSVFVKNYK